MVIFKRQFSVYLFIYFLCTLRSPRYTVYTFLTVSFKYWIFNTEILNIAICYLCGLAAYFHQIFYIWGNITFERGAPRFRGEFDVKNLWKVKVHAERQVMKVVPIAKWLVLVEWPVEQAEEPTQWLGRKRTDYRLKQQSISIFPRDFNSNWCKDVTAICMRSCLHC